MRDSAVRALARASSSRYFVRSTPVTEKPSLDNGTAHLPGPQQRSRADLPFGLARFSACLTVSGAVAKLCSENMKGYVARHSSSLSNHSDFLVCFPIIEKERPDVVIRVSAK